MTRRRWFRPQLPLLYDMPYETRPPTDPGSLQAENAELRAMLADRGNELLAARQSLRDARNKIRELTDQIRAGRLMLAAALKECEGKCPHARVAEERAVQLSVMQERLTELQRANERRDVSSYATGFTPGRYGGQAR